MAAQRKSPPRGKTAGNGPKSKSPSRPTKKAPSRRAGKPPAGPSKRTTPPKAKDAPTSSHFSQARGRAERLLRDPDATDRLVEEASKRTKDKRSAKLGQVIEELRAMLRLVPAYAKGDYRAVSWESMVLVVAALIYLVSPIDLIPDVLPFGLADDATVVMFVVGLIHEELEDFIEWEKARGDDGRAGVSVAA